MIVANGFAGAPVRDLIRAAALARSDRQRLAIIEAIYHRSIAGSVTATRLYLRHPPQPLRR